MISLEAFCDLSIHILGSRKTSSRITVQEMQATGIASTNNQRICVHTIAGN